MDVTTIIERLKAQLAPALKGGVQETDDMMSALATLKAGPAAFVMFAGERVGAPGGTTGVIRQRVVYAFTVFLGFTGTGVGNLVRGSEAEGVKDRVRDALLGWQPAGADEPIIYAGSRVALMDLDKSILLLAVNFSTAYQLRKVETT